MIKQKVRKPATQKRHQSIRVKISGTSDMKKIKDLKDRPLLLFVNSWSVGMVLDRNEGLVLSEFGTN